MPYCRLTAYLHSVPSCLLFASVHREIGGAVSENSKILTRAKPIEKFNTVNQIELMGMVKTFLNLI